MKKIHFRKSFWQALLSVIVLAAFAYIGIASFGVSQQKKQLPDGRWEISKHYSSGKTESTTGNVDDYGRWEGPVTIVYENSDYIATHTEEVNMKGGKRHGISKITYQGGKVAHICYQYGVRVETEDCENNANKSALANSAYQVFSYKVPWFAFKLDALGYDSLYVKAYLDTLESLLYTNVFSEEEFDDFYDDVVYELEETAYDSIILLNSELSLYLGIDLILSHEFRLATLYSYMKSDGNTYHVIETIHPNYLSKLNALDVTDADFEGFCREFDGIMSSYDPVALDDPYLIDSLDERMYRTIDYIYSNEEGTASVSQSLKSAQVTGKARSIRALQREYLTKVSSQPLEKTPSEVAEIVMFTILENFINGDLIKAAVREAYVIGAGIVSLPTVITDFSDHLSSTSVTVSGKVTEDGGGTVTSRGMAWGPIYNPTINDQMVAAGNGTGDFEVTLTELTTGETYYARAYATNSAGTAYGNCISFVAASTIGIDVNKLNNLDFSIYPNPASDNMTLAFNVKDSRGMVLTMFDLSGRVVFQKELTGVVQGENMINITLPEIEGGVYTCQIKGDDQMQATQKLLIKR